VYPIVSHPLSRRIVGLRRFEVVSVALALAGIFGVVGSLGVVCGHARARQTLRFVYGSGSGFQGERIHGNLPELEPKAKAKAKCNHG
jgi:hypothetical protein